MQTKKIQVDIVNPKAAGIDVGSKSHFVCVGQKPNLVKEFGVNTSDHLNLINYLKDYGIETIAMESTGSYWQSLFTVLQEAGFGVVLVPGSQTKVGIKKTDVLDCQHIQKLHMLGMLSGCYLPDEATSRIRNIARHRTFLVEQAAKNTNKISKALRLMNIRLDNSIRDVVGKSGKAIIEAILNGERDAAKLVELVDCRVKKPKEEIVLNLAGQWNDELLYELRDSYELLKIYNTKIRNCDLVIEQILDELNVDKIIDPSIQLAKKQDKGKHACNASLAQQGFKLYGVDLMAIPGIGPGVMLSMLSELGTSISKFDSSKQFCSWLRLSPNNKISGGRILGKKPLPTKSLLSKAFKDAANAVGLSKQNDSLCSFFRKIAFKKGRGAAIKATARKIATIVYTMIVSKKSYQPLSTDDYKEAQRKKKIKYITETMKKLNISTLDLQPSPVS